MKKKTLRLSPLTLAIASALCAPSAQANPTGGQVVSGSASIQSAGSQTTVNQSSNRAVINWQSFSINRGESTRFNLPSSSSAVLNRVTGGNPSELLGSLSSNGKVFLINPNGILVGAGATINTNAFFASTRDVNNQQFMDGGNLDFFGSSNASVVNLGTISAAGGDVVLLAHTVENQGDISAPSGSVALASSTELLYAPTANERVVVKATALKDGGSVVNEGAIAAAQVELKAAGGNPYALAVNAGGSISAISLNKVGGRIVLNAKSGTTKVSGDLTAQKGNNGGEIVATGQHVNLTETAKLNASGPLGGGRIAVGGGYQGKDASLQNAETTRVAKGALLNADATVKGNGGQITIWANDTTQYLGHASARGGVYGGDGGFAEVSGKKALGYAGTVDLRASLGKTGNLLLDPTDITITDAGAPTGSIAVAGNTSIIHVTDLNNELQLANVTISTSSAGGGHGDITVANGASSYTFFGAHDLTLDAERDITVNESLAVVDGTLNPSLTLKAGRNLAINNPDGMTAVTSSRDMTLIAGAAQDGAGPGTITFAPGLVLGGSGANRIFAPYEGAIIGLSNASFLFSDPATNKVTGKWVNDTGTASSGVYYKSATRPTNYTDSNLTTDQSQNAANGGSIRTTGTTLIQSFSNPAESNQNQLYFGIPPLALESMDEILGVIPKQDPTLTDPNKLRESIAYWESTLNSPNMTEAFRKDVEAHIAYEKSQLEGMVGNRADLRAATFQAYNHVPGPQAEIDRLQGEIDKLTQEILQREIDIKRGTAATDMLTLGLAGWINDLAGDAQLNDMKDQLAGLAAQKAAIDGSAQKAQLAFAMVARVSELLKGPGPYSDADQALIDNVIQRAQNVTLNLAETQLQLYQDWKASVAARKQGERLNTSLALLFDVGDMAPDFGLLAQQKVGIGTGSSAAAGVMTTLITGTALSIASSDTIASQLVEKVMPYSTRRAKEAAKLGTTRQIENVADLESALTEAKGSYDDLVKQTSQWIDGIKPSETDRASSLAKAAKQFEKADQARSALPAARTAVEKADEAVKLAKTASNAIKLGAKTGEKAVAKAASKIVSKAGLVVEAVISVAMAAGTYAAEAAISNEQEGNLQNAVNMAKNTPLDLRAQLSSEDGRLGLVNLLAASFSGSTGFTITPAGH